MFLAENGATNSESIEVNLKVCDEQIRTSCIEPLPDNAPPELIKIRDKKTVIIRSFSSVSVKIEIIKYEGDKKPQFEIVEIEPLGKI